MRACVCVRSCTCVCARACMHACVCVCGCARVHAYACVCECARVRILLWDSDYTLCSKANTQSTVVPTSALAVSGKDLITRCRSACIQLALRRVTRESGCYFRYDWTSGCIVRMFTVQDAWPLAVSIAYLSRVVQRRLTKRKLKPEQKRLKMAIPWSHIPAALDKYASRVAPLCTAEKEVVQIKSRLCKWYI